MTTIYSRLNISMVDQKVRPVINMVQYDSGRGIDAFLTNDSLPTDVGSETDVFTANLYARKANGEDVIIPSESITEYKDSGAYEVKFANRQSFSSLLDTVGFIRCQIALRNSEDIVTSFEFLISVHENLSEVMSDNAKLEARITSLENNVYALITGNSNVMIEIDVPTYTWETLTDTTARLDRIETALKSIFSDSSYSAMLDVDETGYNYANEDVTYTSTEDRISKLETLYYKRINGSTLVFAEV